MIFCLGLLFFMSQLCYTENMDSTEKPIEKVNPMATISEKPGGKPDVPVPVAPIAEQSQKPIEKPMEKPIETVLGQPLAKPAEKLAETSKPAEQLEKLPEKLVQEKPAEKVVQKIADKPKPEARIAKQSKIKAPSKLEMVFSRIFDHVALQDKINFARHLALGVK